MAAKVPTLTIDDLTGGVNDSDSPSTIPLNAVVDARNVDLREGKLGSKRRGCVDLDLTGSVLVPPILGLFRHTPTNNIGNDELWAVDADGTLDRRVGGTWQGGVAAVNEHVDISEVLGDENAVSLHGKLFIAAKTPANRLLVWDGSVLRWAGFAQTPDPTVADTGTGTLSGTRYYRIRYIERDADDTFTIRRSEPSNPVAFVPSGAGSGALITKPAGTEATTSLYCEGQTHWEVEASQDNALFYRIATVAIATPTYTDTTAFATGYAAFPLSEQIGEYVPPQCVRHVAADEDRLVVAGHRYTPASDATVWWSPVHGDDGVGNDERIPETTKNRLTIDGLDGGAITSLVPGISGSVFVPKFGRICRLQRTGNVENAYSLITESVTRGALMRAACAGSDAAGNPCMYALDGRVGLIRVSKNGIDDLALGIRDTWKIRNRFAIPRIVFHAEESQVWFFVPLGLSLETLFTSDGVEILTADGVAIHPNQSRQFNHETRYGSNWYHTGLPAATKAIVIFPDVSTGELKPVVSIGNRILQADTGTTDAGTPYRAYLTTRPYELGGLFTKFVVKAAVLLARASDALVGVTLQRDYGKGSKTVTADLNATQTSTMVPLDNASIGECLSVQFVLGDAPALEGVQLDQAWSLDGLVCRYDLEENAA